MDKKKSFVLFCLSHADLVDIVLMALGFIGAVVDGLSSPVLLFFTSKLLNNLGGGGPNANNHNFLENMNKTVELILYAGCGFWVACFLEGYCWARTGERQARRMRMKYLKAVLRQDVGYFDLQATTTTEIINSVSNDSIVIQDTISEKVPNFLMNISMFISGIVIEFILEWRLALVSFPFIFLLVAPSFIYGSILIGLARKNIEAYNKAGGIAGQAIASVRTVYSFVGEEKTVKEFSEALQVSVKVGIKQGLAKGLVMGGHGVVFIVCAFVYWYGSRMVMYHGTKGGNVFSVAYMTTLVGQALGSGLSNMKSFSEAYSAGERIMLLIERVPEIDSDSIKGEILPNLSGAVEFKGVEFAYPSRPTDKVFTNLSISLESGKSLALVGESGSGKSTIISLLQRFYDPIKGEILFDGVSINKLQVKWLRSQMGLVSQEPSLFATSVKENILFGNEEATMDEIVEAAKIANAHKFISRLPQGYDTQVGERGVQMSGGQKQRIAITRAMIRKPRILLLDEATSALDSESERIVQEALDKAAVGRTTIVIAHRLSTIRNVDIIAVMRSGEVMEIGSHDELSENTDGVYTSLLKIQRIKVRDDENKPNCENPVVTKGEISSLEMELSPGFSKVVSDEKNIEKKEAIAKTPSFRKLLLLSLPEWKQAIIGCLGAAIVGAIQPLYGYIMGSMIHVLFLPSHSEIKKEMEKYSLLFCGIGAGLMVFNLLQHYNFAAMGEYLTKRIREKMLAKMLTFEVEWYDQVENSTGAVCSKLAKDANLVKSLVGDRMSLLLQTFFLAVVSSIMGLIISWKFALVIIATQPLIIICLYGRRVVLISISKKSTKSQEESSKLAAEAVTNIKTITAFSSQIRFLSMFNEAQKAPQKESKRQAWFAGVALGTCRILISSSWALDFWYGGRLVHEGEITTKALFETVLILVLTGKVIADAGALTTDIARGSEAVSSVFSILARQTKILPDDSEGYKPDTLTGHVEFQNVHFVYPSRPNIVVLKNLSLVISEGKSTALVGSSGSGKSTIIALIERFYDPLKGLVSIDRRDMKTYNLRCLRKHMALVSQEPTLFAGTIRDNITYGGPEKLNEMEIVDAAKAANAHDFITQLKDGYDTWCGDRGTQLSGGQKQRIAIARAILKNPSILLLDEATSALDGPSERIVQSALERLMIGRTTIVVAHRLSTIQNCDQIVVMDQGTVAEKGTHSSLLEKGKSGAYYSLIAHQQHGTNASEDGNKFDM